MLKRFIHTILFFISFILLFTGCLDDEFATNPNNRLAFSTDTVRFDTLFTTIGSSTSRLMVYNPNKKALRINTITLKKGADSHFKINVDGMKGDSFEQIEINKNDSLYIFVEAKVDPTNQDRPVRTEDIVEFEYNGLRQQIILEAYGQDAIMWHGKIISNDTILSATKPFLIYDSLLIKPDVCLKLEAGTRLFLHDKASIKVQGQLLAEGKIGTPVLMRGDRTDKLFHNLPYEQVPGQWGGLIFENSSFNNQLTQTRITGSSFGIRIDSTSNEQPKLTLNGCMLRNSKEELLKATNARITAANCEFSNAGGALLHLSGGHGVFSHCTFVNLYAFGVINDMAIHLTNYKRDEQGNNLPIPLLAAQFNNCIIWGKRSLEVNLDPDKPTKQQDILFAHFFDHCLIKANGEDDENFQNTIWNEDPLFREIDEDNYRFDLRLDSISPARNAGNPVYAIEFPTDINGTARPSASADLGAYQFELK